MSNTVYDILSMLSIIVNMNVEDIENTLWFACILCLSVEGKENPSVSFKITENERKLLKVLVNHRDDLVHRYTKKKSRGILKVLIFELCEEFKNHETYYKDSSMYLLQNVYGG